MSSILSLQEYYDLVGSEGLLYKAYDGQDAMHFDGSGKEPMPSIDDCRLVISTIDPDRLGDVLDPRGLQLDNFALNPLFLYEHAKRLEFSKSILGRCRSITITDNLVTARVQYVPLNSNPLPAEIWELEQKGLMPGNSIGWRPLGDITIRDGRRHVGKWEMLEISKVILPVNGKASNRQLSA